MKILFKALICLLVGHKKATKTWADEFKNTSVKRWHLVKYCERCECELSHFVDYL